MGFRFGSAQSRVSTEIVSSVASKPRFRWISPTCVLCIEQSPTYQEQIRERRSSLEPVQVLRQAPVTHFLKAEDPLDDPEHVLNFGAHTGLATVGRLDRLINALAPAIALVGEVLVLINRPTPGDGRSRLRHTPYSSSGPRNCAISISARAGSFILRRMRGCADRMEVSVAPPLLHGRVGAARLNWCSEDQSVGSHSNR